MRMDQSETTRAASKKGKGGGGAVGKLLRSPFKRGETATRVSACGGGCGDSGSGSGRVGSAARPMDRDAVEVDGPGNAKIEQDYELYPWEKKMRDLLPLPSSSVFLSLLLLPRISDHSSSHYNTLEDTLARANAWLNSAQASGIPIVFMNVQTEALLTKISGDTASSTVNMGSLADLAKLSNVSLYGFEDYHGVDIGVVRAVRIWYAPIAGEMTLEIKLLDSDTRLGFAISRTDEGFIYISSVADDNSPGVAATRCGLRGLYKEAKRASKRLVISRVGNEKVLPWMVSTTGDIKCFDTVSLSQKLSLHRHALKPVLLHLLMWEDIDPSSFIKKHYSSTPPPSVTLPALANEMPDEIPRDMSFGDDSDSGVSRETVGDPSFRFQNISLPDSWV
ncbi:uncharacterized protein [Typha latifolia]|uniref:uncharacterized protein isoform X3 n=1 Tax=Typha latifolia TaxID=4733 RepID=UPI003C2FBF39